MSKTHKLLIPISVEKSLKKQVNYIKKEQGKHIADDWLSGLIIAIESLTSFPERFQIAPEHYLLKNSKIIIRHLIYKKSFRIIFTTSEDEVRVLSIKHSARKRSSLF